MFHIYIHNPAKGEALQLDQQVEAVYLHGNFYPLDIPFVQKQLLGRLSFHYELRRVHTLFCEGFSHCAT